MRELLKPPITRRLVRGTEEAGRVDPNAKEDGGDLTGDALLDDGVEQEDQQTNNGDSLNYDLVGRAGIGGPFATPKAQDHGGGNGDDEQSAVKEKPLAEGGVQCPGTVAPKKEILHGEEQDTEDHGKRVEELGAVKVVPRDLAAKCGGQCRIWFGEKSGAPAIGRGARGRRGGSGHETSGWNIRRG